MKKNYVYAAAMAAMLASCSSENLSLPQAAQEAEAPGIAGAVNFSAYTPRSITRAGYSGELTGDVLDNSKEDGGGFGVFGYYTDQQDYDLQVSKPNFMYNQGVFWETNKWNYTPLKYWPNEYGSDAESQDIDKVSFFAYAPFVEVNALTGKVTDTSKDYGITAVSRNTNTGDPLVWYKGSFSTSETVDLCWGVVGNASDADWSLIQDKAIQKMDAGFPWLNVQRPENVTDQKLKFTFKHALAQLNIQIDADPDITVSDETTDLGSKTKIYVRSITINGLASKGSLNLNNIVSNEPLWQSYYGSGAIYSESATIYDGRRDGKEGVSGADAVNEVLRGLNPNIISGDVETTGVTKDLQNLFASDGNDKEKAVYVIPTGEPMSISIVYDVETADQNLASVLCDGSTKGSSIENKITKEISFPGDEFIKAGNKYTLKLHLGLNSVKFDAGVSDWIDQTANPAESWLPNNTGKGVSITDGANVITKKLASSTTPASLTAVIQPSDVVNTDIQWTTDNDKVDLSATTGATVTVTPKDNYVGPVTVNAYNPGTGKTATVTVYCTHKASAPVAADLGRVVSLSGDIYLHANDVIDYSETANDKGVGMMADVTNKRAIVLSNYNRVNRAAYDTQVASDYQSFYGTVTGGTYNKLSAVVFQEMFKAVGENGWGHTYAASTNGDTTEDVNDGPNGVKVTTGNQASGVNSYTPANTKNKINNSATKFDVNVVWGSTVNLNTNRIVSCGKICVAMVACGGTNFNNEGYWLSDVYDSDTNAAWAYRFDCSRFWNFANTDTYNVRPYIQF